MKKVLRKCLVVAMSAALLLEGQTQMVLAAEINQEREVQDTENTVEQVEVQEESLKEIVSEDESVSEEINTDAQDELVSDKVESSNVEPETVDEIQPEDISEPEEILENNEDDFEIENGVLEKYKGNDRIVHIPDGVIKIYPGAISGENIEEVYLSDSVKVVNNYAVRSCPKLKYVDFGKVETLYGNIFDRGISGVCVKIPGTITTVYSGFWGGDGKYDPVIQYGPFSGAVNKVIFEDGITAIPDDLFINCKDLKSVDFPEGLTKIGENTFRESGLSGEIQLPETVTVVGEFAFCDCSELSLVKLPDNLEELGTDAFADCKEVLNTKIPKTLKTCHNPFARTEVKNVSFEEGLTRIPDSLFNYTTVPEVILPEGIEEIGKEAFSRSNVEKIVFPASLKRIKSFAFQGHSLSELVLPDTIESIETGAFWGTSDPDVDKLKKVVIGRGISNIDGSWFAYNSVLEEIFIPETVTEIYDYAFGCGTIYCKSGTAAEKFAKKRGLNYVVDEIPVVDFEIIPGDIRLEPKQSAELKVNITPSFCSDQVKFKSSNTNVATINKYGIIHATGLGKAIIKVTVGAISKTITVTVGYPVHEVSNIEDFQSPHDYANNCNEIWQYVEPDATEIMVTFSDKTEVEEDFDFIYISDFNDNQIGVFTGKELAGKTITVPGNTIRVRLVSDGDGVAYGFSAIPAGKSEYVTYIENLARSYKARYQNKEEREELINWFTSDADRIIQEFEEDLKAHGMTWSEAIAIAKRVIFEEN